MTLNRRQLFRLVGAELLSLPSEQQPLSLLSRSLSNPRLRNPCCCALTKTRWA